MRWCCRQTGTVALRSFLLCLPTQWSRACHHPDRAPNGCSVFCYSCGARSWSLLCAHMKLVVFGPVDGLFFLVGRACFFPSFLFLSYEEHEHVASIISPPPPPSVSHGSHASLREWVNWLTSQSSSPSGGGLGGREELLERHPYRSVFVGCESLEAAEAAALCDGLRGAVFTRLVEEQ